MQTLSYTVGAAEDGKKLKHVLRGELQLSSTLLKTLKWREGAIRLNGETVRVDATVHAGDAITVTIDEREMREDDVKPINLPLDIVFEDEFLLVLNKPGDLAMHPKST
ncbi:MAG: RluA family pseudouridine synthase, partial [Oscillospiraceae bacterium]|nr:RluA family pseudouridine synthase [Oscillospiraceae bacterium]